MSGAAVSDVGGFVVNTAVACECGTTVAPPAPAEAVTPPAAPVPPAPVPAPAAVPAVGASPAAAAAASAATAEW